MLLGFSCGCLLSRRTNTGIYRASLITVARGQARYSHLRGSRGWGVPCTICAGRIGNIAHLHAALCRLDPPSRPRLRPLGASTSVLGLDPAYCTPNPQDVAQLKSELFALDAACSALAADEKSRIVALITQSLRMLNRVAVCAPTLSTAPGADDRPTTVEGVQTPTLPVATSHPLSRRSPGKLCRSQPVEHKSLRQ